MIKFLIERGVDIHAQNDHAFIISCGHGNIEIVKLILKYLGKSENMIKFVKDRPGHDRRYAIDSTKIQRELEWKPKFSFEQAIYRTIDWYVENQSWWEKIISGEYLQYFAKQYKM
jgi:dTDP-glucose 4,6-dehydratase